MHLGPGDASAHRQGRCIGRRLTRSAQINAELKGCGKNCESEVAGEVHASEEVEADSVFERPDLTEVRWIVSESKQTEDDSSLICARG